MLLVVRLLLTLVLPSVGPCPLVRVSSFVLFACFVPCVRTCLRAVLLFVFCFLLHRNLTWTLEPPALRLTQYDGAGGHETTLKETIVARGDGFNDWFFVAPINVRP